MATYNSYEGVEKLQKYLETQLVANVISGPSLRSRNGEFDGQYGPNTNAALLALAAAVGGHDWKKLLKSLVEDGTLTDGDVADIAVAMREFNAGGVGGGASNGGNGAGTDTGTGTGDGTGTGAGTTDLTTPPPPPPKEGLSTWAWIGIGAGVAAAGLLAWWLYKRSQAGATEEMEPEMAGLGGDDFGCGCGK